MDKACLWWDQMTSGIRRVGSRLVCQTESLPLGNQGSDANLARLVRIKRNRLQLPSYIARCATAPGSLCMADSYRRFPRDRYACLYGGPGCDACGPERVRPAARRCAALRTCPDAKPRRVFRFYHVRPLWRLKPTKNRTRRHGAHPRYSARADAGEDAAGAETCLNLAEQDAKQPTTQGAEEVTREGRDTP